MIACILTLPKVDWSHSTPCSRAGTVFMPPHIKPPLLQPNKFCCQSYHDGHCSSWCAIVWDYTCMNGTGYGMGTGLGTIRNLHKLQIGNRPGNAQWQWPSLVSTLQELLISLPRAASSFPTFSALSHYKCIAQPISTYMDASYKMSFCLSKLLRYNA